MCHSVPYSASSQCKLVNGNTQTLFYKGVPTNSGSTYDGWRIISRQVPSLNFSCPQPNSPFDLNLTLLSMSGTQRCEAYVILEHHLLLFAEQYVSAASGLAVRGPAVRGQHQS